MYQVVSFEAVVLLEMKEKEYDATYVLYTRELGKIYVKARGIKKPGAKHSMNMQPLNLVNIDAIRGVAGWKLIGSSLSFGYRKKTDNKVISLWGRVLRVALDLTPVEQPEEELYLLIMKMLNSNLVLTDRLSLSYIEAGLISDVLKVLGWWNSSDVSNNTFDKKEQSREFVVAVNKCLENAYS